MSVIQLWAKRCKRTPVLARGDDPPEPPAHGGASRPPVPPWGLACRTMNQRVLVASNRGPVSYQFGADGSLTGSRGGGGMIAGVADGLAALGPGASATWICAALSDADRAVARAEETGPGDGGLREGIPVRMLDIAPDIFDRAY